MMQSLGVAVGIAGVMASLASFPATANGVTHVLSRAAADTSVGVCEGNRVDLLDAVGNRLPL